MVSVPVTVWVTGARPGERTWVQLDFQANPADPVTVGRAAGVPTRVRRLGNDLQICLTTPTEGSIRRVAVPLAFTLIPQPPVNEEFGIPDPPRGLASRPWPRSRTHRRAQAGLLAARLPARRR